jgi:predicted nucleic acid-binding Zn ribbon protein
MAKNPTLCKYSKEEIKDQMDILRKLVKDPRYICKKCARASHDDERLCKPEKI